MRRVLVLLLFSAGSFAQIQSTCPAPPVLTVRPGSNMFTDEQEMILGDIVAEQVESELRIQTGASNDYLQQVGDRVAAQLPPSKLRFRFVLIDQPFVNAFSMPGGRVYVTRKLIAFVHSEDELAGVLAHEMGHIITHQPAIHFTDLFHQVLGVNSVTDRADIYTRYHQLQESTRKKPKAFRENSNEEEHEQLIADTISVYAVARAGYRPAAFAEFWDRMTEIKGKTGNWFSDAFGATKPAQKRLREILRYSASISSACVGAPVSNAGFTQWKEQVIANDPDVQAEVLPGLIKKQSLDPALRSDILTIQFSPNGKYLLAQDESGIFVLSRSPFKHLFRIPTLGARGPHFTADSSGIAFHTHDLRVELWDVAQQKRVWAQELTRRIPCLQTQLSPDASTIACLDSDFELDLVEVSSGKKIFEQKNFSIVSQWEAFFLDLLLPNVAFWGELPLANMSFSPDSHYFIASRNAQWTAIDLTTKNKVPLPNTIREILRRSFTFLGPDRIAGINPDASEKSSIVSFPSGAPIATVPLAYKNSLSAPGHGDYILLRPISKQPVGVMEVSTRTLVLAYPRSALDMYDDNVAVERVDGELAIFDRHKLTGEALGLAPLPMSSLGNLDAFSVSPDFHYIAVSGRQRGAVWDLQKNKRLFHVRGFKGGYFSSQFFIADFPKSEEMKRQITRLNLETLAGQYGSDLSDDDPRHQYGKFLLAFKPNHRGSSELRQNVTLEVTDVVSDSLLFQRNFSKERPSALIGADENTLSLFWPLHASAVKDELRDDSLAAARARAVDRETGVLAEVLQANTGNIIGKVIIDTGKGSFRVKGASAAASTLVLHDSERRILVYSLKSGDLKGRLFGDEAVLSPDGKTLTIHSADRHLTIYDTDTLEKKNELVFSSAVERPKFSPDSKRMLVLSKDQQVYIFDIAQMQPVPSAN